MASSLYSWTVAPLLRFVRAFVVVVVLSCVAVAALLLLPMAIDWQSHKPRLVALLGEATGREVTIDGPIELVLLPRPALRVGDIKVGNAPGAASPFLLEASRVAARLSWRALLQGRVEVTRIALDEPRVAIEPTPDGKPNWWLPLLDARNGGAPPLVPLSVDRVEIKRGHLAHARGLVGQSINADAVDLDVRLEDGANKIHVTGSAVTNGVPVTLALEMQPGASDKPPFAFSLAVPGGLIGFNGWAGQRTAAEPLRGHATVSTRYLPEFVRSVSMLVGASPLRLNEALPGEVEAQGAVTLVGERLTLERFSLRTAGESVLGFLRVQWQDGVSVSGALKAATLDADRWIERLRDRPLVLPAENARGAAGHDAAAADGAPAYRIELAVEASAVRYRKGTVKDLAATFHVEPATFRLLELSAVLPGDFRLHRKAGFEGDQVHPGYDGVIEVDARDLRQTLKWIGIDTSAVPADRLRTLRLSGKTRPAKGFVHVEDATFALDDQTGSIAADIALSLPSVISARLHMSRLDLDAYRLDRAELQRMMPTSPAVAEAPGIEPPLFDFAVAIDEVRYRGQPAREIDARVLMRGNLLTLKHVGVGALLGAHLEISGSVDQFGIAPRLDLAWRGVLPDTDRVLDYAGLPRFINGRIGPAQIAGKVAGTLRDITVSELSLAMLDTTIAATGKVSFGDSLRYDFAHWSLESPDIGHLASVASGSSRRALGEFRASGAFHGDEHQAAFRGDLEIEGMPLRGDVSSTLGPRPRISAALQAPDGLSLDPWLPPPPQVGAAHAAHAWATGPEPARRSAGLEGLRGFDGTLSLTTPALQWGPYTMNDIRLSARSQQGVLQVDRLSGRLEGAQVSLGGTVDVRGPATALVLRGSLRDIDISRTIAFAHTANDFGSDDLAVAIEGRLTLEDLELRSSGDTFESHLLSATASGRTSAQLRPLVTRGSLSLASFATGLGSLFSTEMGFASAVIEHFVGKWIATRGQLEIGLGALTLREHTLESPGATAYVTSRIDLGTGRLDTSIQLDRGPNGRIEYNMSLSGPLRSPTLRAQPNPSR